MMNYLNSAWWFTVKKYIILTSAGGKVSGPLAEYIAGQTGGPLQVVAVLTGHRTSLTLALSCNKYVQCRVISAGPFQVVAVLTGHRTTLTGICPAKNMCSDEG